MEALIATVSDKIRQGELRDAIDLISHKWNKENLDWEIAMATLPRGDEMDVGVCFWAAGKGRQ